MTLRFQSMLFKFLGMVVLSIILWQAQDFIASFAASERVTQATLRTTEERDDARPGHFHRRAAGSAVCAAASTVITKGGGVDGHQ